MINNVELMTEMGLLSELAYLNLESNVYQEIDNDKTYSFLELKTFIVENDISVTGIKK